MPDDAGSMLDRFAAEQAMAKRYVKQLNELTPEARRRVLTLVADFFGLAVDERPKAEAK